MKIRYTPQARRHLEAIAAYVAEHDRGAALRIGRRVRQTIELLAVFPHIGRHGSLAGTREMPLRGLPYLIVYRADETPEPTLVVLGVYHGAQRRPGV